MTIAMLSLVDLDDTVQSQVSELYKQLNPTIEQWPFHEILKNNQNTAIVACKDNNIIVGIALMAIYKVISGHKGMIEDVVVHADYRGKGIGKELMQRLLLEAKNKQLNEVLLFSGHHRHQAINLYKSLGFQLKDSGLYRLVL